jgi:hypothetical protein
MRSMLCAAIVILAVNGGCGAGEKPTGGTETALLHVGRVSDCGGFSADQKSLSVMSRDPSGYCDAETLRWTYDVKSQQLELINERVILICCGDRAVTFSREQQGYVTSETDAPREGETRCRCVCAFDIAVTAESITEQSMRLALTRHVTDAGAPRIVFEGSLDLRQGGGAVVIDPKPSVYCD